MNKIFLKEEEQQICNEYFSKERPSTITLGKKWGCRNTTIRFIIKRNGYSLRTISRACKGRKAWNKKFIKEQELQICKEYFSKGKPSTYVLAKKWNCGEIAICDVIKRNGYDLRTYKEVSSSPKAIQRSLKNGFGTNCYYHHKFFPSLSERDCYIYLIKLGYKVIHNFLGRFDFLVILPNNKRVVVEYHPYDLKGLTNNQYYNQRRKLLNEYGYKNLKLVVIKDLREIETKLK